MRRVTRVTLAKYLIWNRNPIFVQTLERCVHLSITLVDEAVSNQPTCVGFRPNFRQLSG